MKRAVAFLAIAAALGAAILVGGCSQSGGNKVSSAVSKTGSLPPPDVPGTYATQTEYRISPLDTLEVSVYQVPDLSRSVEVDAAGHIMLPLIGDVVAAGRTAEELAGDIGSRLGAKYLESPQVTVFVKEAPGQQVTVEGAVNKPGMFPITGTTTLLQAVALSGGLSDLAKADDVTVFRMIQNQRMAAVFNVKTIRTGKMADPEIYGGDLIVVGQSGVRSTLHAMSGLGGVAPIVGVFGPFMY